MYQSKRTWEILQAVGQSGPAAVIEGETDTDLFDYCCQLDMKTDAKAP